MNKLETYLGIPWLSGGRTITGGLDCWGLLRYVYLDLYGIKLPVHAVPIGTLAEADPVVEAEIGSHSWLEIVSPEDGDVVALGRGAGFCHVGVYVETPAPAILHTSKDCNSAIVPLRTLYRQGYRNVKYYRHVERRPNR